MASHDFTLTREEVADRLRVSVRTVDRYIRRHLFEVQRAGRQVWVSKKSFDLYLKSIPFEGAAEATTSPVSLSSDPKSLSPRSETLLPSSFSQEGSSELEATLLHRASRDAHERVSFSAHPHDSLFNPTTIYKTLYEDLKEKHDEQVKRLEGAHYRVGQLEAQVKSMIPLVDHKREQRQLLLVNEQYKATVQEAQLKLTDAKHRVHREQLNKNVYISLVYGLLALHVVFWALLR